MAAPRPVPPGADGGSQHDVWICRCSMQVSLAYTICPHCSAQRPSDVYYPRPRMWTPHDRQPFSSEQTRGSDVPYYMSPGMGEQQLHQSMRSTQQALLKLLSSGNSKVQCNDCKTEVEKKCKFCPECGAKMPRTVEVPAQTSNPLQNIMPYQSSVCYYCDSQLKYDDKQAGPGECTNPNCKMRQPTHEPQGPLCSHGCGARLLTPEARICERCHRESQSIKHNIGSSPPAVLPQQLQSLLSVIGYSLQPQSQQFSSPHILAVPTPVSHQSISLASHGNDNVSTCASGYSIEQTVTMETSATSGHPLSAWPAIPVERSGLSSSRQINETKLQTPIQETSYSPTSLVLQPTGGIDTKKGTREHNVQISGDYFKSGICKL